MKNLLAYTPEPFDNLEYAPLVGGAELEQEEGEAGRRRRRSSSRGLRRPRYLNTRRPQQSPAAEPQGGSGGSTSSVGGSSPAGQDGSEHVRWVQETLNRALGLRLIVDGIMNRETRSAVRMFQERKGLPVTGLVGPDTEEALRAEGEWEILHSAGCLCPSCGGDGDGELALEISGPWKKIEEAFEGVKCPECDRGKLMCHRRNKGAVDVYCTDIMSCGYEAQIKSIYIGGEEKIPDIFPDNIKTIRGGSLAALEKYRSKKRRIDKSGKGLPPPLIIVLYNNEKANVFYLKPSNEMIKSIPGYLYKITREKPKLVCRKERTDKRKNDPFFRGEKCNLSKTIALKR